MLKNKVFTLSYDDGVLQDRQMVEILNYYNIKCTFNLNSGFIGSNNQWNYKNLQVRYLSAADALGVYKGHEIALHTCTHPYLEKLQPTEMEKEIAGDKTALEKLFKTKVEGMAYPYGTYNQTVQNVACRCGVKYARTVVCTHAFLPPQNFLEWHFTCHHNDEKLMTLAEHFCALEDDGLNIFSVWGHSYEFEGDGNWQVLENLCKYISGQKNVYSATNVEIRQAF